MFQDAYIDKEENRKVLELIIKFLTDESLNLNQIDSEDADVNEYNFIPNINKEKTLSLNTWKIQKNFVYLGIIIN
jgi:hypothetical protein